MSRMNDFPYSAREFAKLILDEVERIPKATDMSLAHGEFTMWTVALKKWLNGKR
jgi:hypothetical protein